MANRVTRADLAALTMPTTAGPARVTRADLAALTLPSGPAVRITQLVVTVLVQPPAGGGLMLRGVGA